MDKAAFWGAILAFVASIIGNVVQWRRNSKDEVAQFRADLLEMNEDLRKEMSDLRKRLDGVQDELHRKTVQLLNHEVHLARIKRVVLDKHGIDLDTLFGSPPITEGLGR